MNASVSRILVAMTANRLADEIHRDGGNVRAPSLSLASDRTTVIAWLMWNDPNGSHTDELAAIDGNDPYTDDDAWAALADMVIE